VTELQTHIYFGIAAVLGIIGLAVFLVVPQVNTAGGAARFGETEARVEFTSPKDGETIEGDSLLVTVVAKTTGVPTVTIFADEVPLQTCIASRCTAQWGNITSGTHLLRATVAAGDATDGALITVYR
jgi:hypothetical protein